VTLLSTIIKGKYITSPHEQTTMSMERREFNRETHRDDVLV